MTVRTRKLRRRACNLGGTDVYNDGTSPGPRLRETLRQGRPPGDTVPTHSLHHLAVPPLGLVHDRLELLPQQVEELGLQPPELRPDLLTWPDLT